MAIQPIPFDAREAQPMDVRAEEGDTIELKRTYCKVCMTNCGIVAEVAAAFAALTAAAFWLTNAAAALTADAS